MSRERRRERLDNLVQELRPDLSRSRVQAEIMAGRVMVDGRVCSKPGTPVSREAAIGLAEPDNPYVSRGGLKLEGALTDLSLEVDGLIVLDVGASTGGFTDCLLQKGARQVYALDVGYGQLAFPLRQDPRVVIMERVNVRNLQAADLPGQPDMAVVDVSFISLKHVLPVLARLGVRAALALVKPQFEAGKAEVDRGRGVIKNPGLHVEILTDLLVFACRVGYHSREIAHSRLPGPKGNIEYFVYFKRQVEDCGACSSAARAAASAAVRRAWRIPADPG